MTTQASSSIQPLALSASSRSQWLGLPEALRDQNVQFWFLQAVGWSGWAGSWMASGYYWGMQPAYNLAVLVGMATGILLTAVLRELYRYTWNRAPWLRVVALLCGSYVIALLWQMAKNVALYEFYGPFLDLDRIQALGWFGYVRGTLSSFYIILCWSGLYFGLKYYRMLLIERDRALTAIAAAREAQLRMLRYQLNPHFLFNTLNAISTLILARDTLRAEAMVNRLSAFLRYSLDGDPTQEVPLIQEISALRLYLEIEQARFEDRLQVEYRLQPDVERARVPGLLLQPLVENAIKYAVARNEHGGRILIDAHAEGDELVIAVEDDGPGLPSVGPGPDGQRVGLANIRERLRQIHGDRQSLALTRSALGGACVRIRMPLQVRTGEGT